MSLVLGVTLVELLNDSFVFPNRDFGLPFDARHCAADRQAFRHEVTSSRSWTRQKLDRLDEAFLYSESIDVTSYDRQRDRLGRS